VRGEGRDEAMEFVRPYLSSGRHVASAFNLARVTPEEMMISYGGGNGKKGEDDGLPAAGDDVAADVVVVVVFGT